MTQLIVIGVINLALGGVVGVVFVAFDFYIRDKILTNAYLFVESSASQSSLNQSIACPPPVIAQSPTTAIEPTRHDYDAQLRKLAQLKRDGVISESDFLEKKREILGI
jgi:hypothetical protein